MNATFILEIKWYVERRTKHLDLELFVEEVDGMENGVSVCSMRRRDELRSGICIGAKVTDARSAHRLAVRASRRLRVWYGQFDAGVLDRRWYEP